MLRIENIIEQEGVSDYLKDRGILPKYKKAKRKILAGHYSGLDIKKRKPHTDQLWSFRIDKKYRALFVLAGDIIVVIAIDDHQ